MNISNSPGAVKPAPTHPTPTPTGSPTPTTDDRRWYVWNVSANDGKGAAVEVDRQGVQERVNQVGPDQQHIMLVGETDWKPAVLFGFERLGPHPTQPQPSPSSSGCMAGGGFLDKSIEQTRAMGEAERQAYLAGLPAGARADVREQLKLLDAGPRPPTSPPPADNYDDLAELDAGWEHDRAFQRWGGSRYLGDLYREKIEPKLTPEIVFTDPIHKWKKDGTKWRGCCPWHDNHSGTAFYADIRNGKLLWRCGGACKGRGGDAIAYIHQVHFKRTGPCRGQDYVEAVHELARRVGVPVEEPKLTEQERELLRKRDARAAILEDATRCCAEVLWSDDPAAVAARNYLNSRGLTDEAIRNLGVGYYDSVRRVCDHLKAAGHRLDDVKDAAVLKKKFEGYLCFPWQDDGGKPLTLYFTWRERTPPGGKEKKLALPNPGKGTPEGEWLHTKESPLYFDRVLRTGHKDIVLVEGLTDAAVAQAHGDTRVVACVAAGVSHLQVMTLKRRGIQSVVICLDPDDAGGNGTESCIQNLIAAGIIPYVARKLPDGLDPDDFINTKGIDAWCQHTADNEHGFRWLAKRLREEHRGQGENPWTDSAVEVLKADAIETAARYPAEHDHELGQYFWPELKDVLGPDLASLQERVKFTRSHRGNGRAGHNPGNIPPPPGLIEAATLEDLGRSGVVGVTWVWEGWIQRGVVNTLTSPAGLGKTRLVLDLLRRMAHGLPWPDGQPMMAIDPALPLAIFVQADGNHDELFGRAKEFGVPLHRILLNAPPSEPRGGIYLADDRDFKPLAARIKRYQPLLCVIDSLTYVTGADPYKAEPLVKLANHLKLICGSTGVTVIINGHTNREGTPLGRRIREVCRVEMNLSQPDPDQEYRRRLWVAKSNSRKPAPLGVTLLTNGCEYDTDPPKAPWEGRGGSSPKANSAKRAEVKKWLLEMLGDHEPHRVADVRDEGDEQGYSAKVIYQVKDELKVIETEGEPGKRGKRPKLWTLPPGAEDDQEAEDPGVVRGPWTLPGETREPGEDPPEEP
jgi:DNA primase catalytic core